MTKYSGADRWQQMSTAFRQGQITLKPLMMWMRAACYEGQGLHHPDVGKSFIWDDTHLYKYLDNLTRNQTDLVLSLIQQFRRLNGWE
jgi:hypothetical protein